MVCYVIAALTFVVGRIPLAEFELNSFYDF